MLTDEQWLPVLRQSLLLSLDNGTPLYVTLEQKELLMVDLWRRGYLPSTGPMDTSWDVTFCGQPLVVVEGRRC